MRHILWLLLAGLIASAAAQLQDGATILELASDRTGPVQDQPSQKTAQGILEAVEAVVSSLKPSIVADTNTAEEAVEAGPAEEGATVPAEEGAVDPAEESGAVPAETSETNPAEASEAAPTDAETPPEASEGEVVEANEAKTPTETSVGAVVEANETETPSETNEGVVVEANETETPAETNEGVVVEKNETETPTETIEGGVVEVNEAETQTPTEASEAIPEKTEEPTAVDVPLTKKELKAIEKYNGAVDQVLAILSTKLKDVGVFPIALDEQSLLVLDDDAVPEPEPETTPDNSSSNRNTSKNKNKNRKNKNKKKSKRNRTEDLEESRKNKNSAEKNNKKSNEKGNRSNEKGNKNKNSGENKKNKNRNKNKKRKNKNKRNNKKGKTDNSELVREPKALDDDEEAVEQGRRKNEPAKNSNKRKNQNRGKGENKRKSSKKNKNKKMKNKGRSEDVQSREESGPVHPTNEERASSNAKLSGLTNLARDGDVTVNLSGKKHKIEARVNLGPLTINLKDKARAITKASVTTSLVAVMKFKVKSNQSPRRSKINVESVEVLELVAEDVTVTRSDLDLEADVITEAQQQVVGAVDTSRVGRILNAELKDIFNKDNSLETLELHPYLHQ